MYASRYSINHSNATLISFAPDDQLGIDAMHLPTLEGMRSDLIEKVVDVTVPSYPVLPYMNMYKYLIKIHQDDIGRMLNLLKQLLSNILKCKVTFLIVNLGVFKFVDVQVYLWNAESYYILVA